MARSTSKTVTPQSAVLYTRVSTQEQSHEGVSLAAQEAKLRTYGALRGLTVVEVVCDAGVSGGKPMHTRVGGQRILDLVKRGVVAHVIAYKLDRLFRDCADCLTVTKDWDKRHVALHLVDLGGQTLDTSSAMGRFFLTVMAGAAELERNLIGERTTEAMAYKKSRHERVGELPYGSQEGPDGKLVEHPSEQAVIATIQQYRTAGLSLRAIVAAAEKAGLTSRAGTPFQLTQIARLLKAQGA
jgi:site-specific DNA recombinase